jgi:DNA-binding SARP family transcriptional activator
MPRPQPGPSAKKPAEPASPGFPRCREDDGRHEIGATSGTFVGVEVIDYRLLGPLEVVVAGRSVKLGGPRQRAVLAALLAQADSVVPAMRLVDELWGEDPPSTAANLVQGYVSHLRKVLGKDAIATHGAGYILHVGSHTLDLREFERLAHDGNRALGAGQGAIAAQRLAEALSLWRGPALADLTEEVGIQPLAARLDELRALARERHIEAELSCGRYAESVPEANALVTENPLRERPRGLLMMALYGSGRQAEALEAYRAAREALVDELGIEPGPWLRGLEAAILRHDPSLGSMGSTATPVVSARTRSIVLALVELTALDGIVALGESLARDPSRELVIVHTVTHVDELGPATSHLNHCRERLGVGGVEARVAAFTSVTPGTDLARLADDHDVDLLLVDAPTGLLQDARLLALLDRAPCDVGVVVAAEPRDGPVLVPFAGTEHDWAAIELAAWLARNRGSPLRLAGASTGADGGNASRLLASASLAIQRVLGVPTEPMLVDPSPEALVSAARGAGVVFVGLTDRWRREGLGRARTALATAGTPTVLVRRGLRPGGIAPRESETRYTWTIGQG